MANGTYQMGNTRKSKASALAVMVIDSLVTRGLSSVMFLLPSGNETEVYLAE